MRPCLVLLLLVVGFADVDADTYSKNRGDDVGPTRVPGARGWCQSVPGSTTATLATVQLSESAHEFQTAVGERPDRVVLDPNHVVLMESTVAGARS